MKQKIGKIESFSVKIFKKFLIHVIVIASRFAFEPKILIDFDRGQPRSGISPTFWIGTAGGCVFFYALSVPDYNHREESKVAPISAKEFWVNALAG